MNNEADIVNAILQLKQESSPIKDYIYPTLISFLSILLGAFSAHYSLKYQQYVEAQKEKLKAVNNWTMKFLGALESLKSFKSNYHGKLNSNPLSRIASIPEIIHSNSKIEGNLGELSFLIPSKDAHELEKENWRNIGRINAMLNNYNFLIEIWTKRNELSAKIIPKLIEELGEGGVATPSKDQLINTIGEIGLFPYIDLTEYAIKLTDDLIIETNDFLLNFYKSSRWCIDL
jgi:hypothetical protein